VGGKLVAACDLLVSMYSSLNPSRVHDRSIWERKQSDIFFDPPLAKTLLSDLDQDIREGTVRLARSFKGWLPGERVDQAVSDLESVLGQFRAVETPAEPDAQAAQVGAIAP
jgi:hypothetical protein